MIQMKYASGFGLYRLYGWHVRRGVHYFKDDDPDNAYSLSPLGQFIPDNWRP